MLTFQEVIEKPKTSGRIKTTLDPKFFFKDPSRRGGRGRGGPGRGPPKDFEGNRREGSREGSGRRPFGDGGGRVGGGGGGRRGNRREKAPNVEDEGDFPSLGNTPVAAM